MQQSFGDLVFSRRFQHGCSERGSVFNCLRSTLREKGQHRVAGVTQQSDAAIRPARQRGLVEQCPNECLVRGRKYFANVAVPVGESGEGTARRSAIRP